MGLFKFPLDFYVPMGKFLYSHGTSNFPMGKYLSHGNQTFPMCQTLVSNFRPRHFPKEEQEFVLLIFEHHFPKEEYFGYFPCDFEISHGKTNNPTGKLPMGIYTFI